MPNESPTADLTMAEAIRAGCTAANVHLACGFPECACKQMPHAIRAAAAILIAPRRVERIPFAMDLS